MSLIDLSPEVAADVGISLDFDVPPRYNIAPGDDILAVRNDEPGSGDMLRWGLVPHWVDDPDEYSRPINARSETVDEKPFFRDAFEERRCLVLADGFYEWKGDRGSNTPYRIERTDRSIFAFAGVWETWRSNGDVLRTCTVLTTEPNETVEPIHDRMPVILENDEMDVWLDAGDPAKLKALLDPYPDDQLIAYRISPAINDPENDGPDVVEPVEDPQTGLEEFG